MSAHNQTENVHVVLSSDDVYAVFVPILLESIATNANKLTNYDITVLDCGITLELKEMIEKTVRKYINISVFFIDVSSYLMEYKTVFVTFAHFTVATYSRFFIPQLLPNFEKVIYLDIDVLVRADLLELFSIDISNHMVAAAIDACYARQIYFDENDTVKYSEEILNLPHGVSQFNAGVLLLNLKKWREQNLTEKCLARLKSIGVPRVLDQCVLNSVIPQEEILNLPIEWNYIWHAGFFDLVLLEPSTFSQLVSEYKNKMDQIKIIHFSSSVKPWNIYFTKSADAKTVLQKLADEWWSFAIKTTGFMRILSSQIGMLIASTNQSAHADTNQIAQPETICSEALERTKKIYVCGVQLITVKVVGDFKLYRFCGIKFLKIRAI